MEPICKLLSKFDDPADRHAFMRILWIASEAHTDTVEESKKHFGTFCFDRFEARMQEWSDFMDATK